MHRCKLAFFFAANLIVLSSAHAADGLAGAAEASFTWRLGFGAGALQPGYGLAVGYRSADADGLSGRLLELDVAGAGAQARLAGLPVFGRSLQRSQNDEAAPTAETTGASPWYARQWVWWTLGGVAATAALAGGGGSLDIGGSGTNDDGDDSGCAENGGCGIMCVNGECVVPCNNIPGDCGPLLGREPVALAAADRGTNLDAGTGGMGDLLARP